MKQNGIAKIIRGFGAGFIVISVFVGIIYGMVVESFLVAIVIILSGILSGIMLIGFAEIISLLQLNVYKTEKLIKALSKDECPQ